MIEATPDDALRRSALSWVGPDARARDALAHGVLFVLPAALEWEGSGGSMRAHVVALGLGAQLLGRACSAPSVKEELERAVSAAFAARRQNQTLADLRLLFTRAPRAAAPYRDAAPAALSPDGEGVDLGAVGAFVEGAGWEKVRALLEGATLEVRPRRVELRLAERAPEESVRALFDALTALSARLDGSAPEVRVTSR